MRSEWVLFAAGLATSACSTHTDPADRVVGGSGGGSGESTAGSGGSGVGSGGTRGNPAASVPAVCTPGAALACTGPGACSGGQFCDADGQWSPCHCGTNGVSEAACASVTEPTKLTPVNLIFMVDKSGSMGNPDSFPPERIDERWNPVAEALIAFFDDPGTTQLNASLEFFPADGSIETMCNPMMYETPRVPLTSLDEDGSAPFIAAIESTSPSGGTPTVPALQGAIDYAIAVPLDDPHERTVVVFATDGEPGIYVDGERQAGCENNDIDHAAEAARAASEGEPSILTYVIGVGTEVAGLDAIADAGGTGTAIMVPVGNPEETRTTFLQELEKIRTLNLSCDISIPEPPLGESLDPYRVNVTHIDSGGESLIGRSDGCPHGKGWQYSEFDEQGLPTVIELCPDNCAAVQGDPTGQLLVQFGCMTVFW